MKKIILSFLALAAISITSCSTDEQTATPQGATQAQEQQVTNKTAKTALAEICSETSTSVTVNRWQAPSSVDSNWTPVAATIGSVNVQWEGIYGASIRPVSNTDHWYVGTVDLDSECDFWNEWKSTIVVKNANLGTAPTDKYNILGYDGTISGTNYGLGYYSYNITTHIMTPARAIVIWKAVDTVPSSLNSQSITNPSAATEAYLVKVTAVTPGSSSSTINYTWTKVL
ncbi:hypothetical protein [Flavobacterium quisquiliarum]|uniref:Lipoprotein n=1 Tax=Flavobacterium quisquiliarum TaxID=1834436 RepID=A0ABV8W535_9FLAO|nr:hypothetical protein [Flavobacterium quisquiliarum]MBW1655670.1 hypothetical protein [Flavobacterium quisquiliarum]NWL03294.1 hypothetical protein [Flavobacterium collinsii]